jgi:hypothetical protein
MIIIILLLLATPAFAEVERIPRTPQVTADPVGPMVEESWVTPAYEWSYKTREGSTKRMNLA